MSEFSDYLEEQLIRHILQGAAYAQPTIYLALSTVDPTDDASGLAEPVGGSYARKAHALWDFDGQVGGAYQSSNNGAITFVTSTGAWGVITHFALFDALTGGNMLYHSVLDASKTMGSGDIFEFADAACKITHA